MKKLLLLVLTVALAIDLSARMNPFEPTDTFFEQQEEYLKNEQLAQQKEEALQREEEQKLLEQQAQQEAELLKEQEKQAKLLAAQKAAQAIKVVEKPKPQEVVKKDIHKILPFVRLEVFSDHIEIFVDKRYKLINQDILEEQKKFLFDFSATESFYTVRKVLQHKDFKSFAVGTHLDKKFFRIVVDLTQNVTNYNEVIDNTTNTIKISKMK